MKILKRIRILVAYWLWKLSCYLYPVGFSPPVIVSEPSKEDLVKAIKSKGRVVKVTAPPEYDPEKKRTGGRIVKRMPRQLQQIKEGQETPRVG